MSREHIDVNRWGRVAREVRAAQQPPAPPPPRPAAATKYVEPTYRDHRAWAYALARPCERHGAAAGALCFDGGGVRGMCAARTNTLGNAAVSRRTTTKETAA